MRPAARPSNVLGAVGRRLRRRHAEHARLRRRVPAARAHVLGHRAHDRGAHLRQPQEDEHLPACPCCCWRAGLPCCRSPRAGPSAHSFGGIVGDWLYKLTATLFMIAGAERRAAARRRSPTSSAASPRSATRSGSSARISTVSLERSRGLARRRGSLWAGLAASAGWLSGFFPPACRTDDFEPTSEPPGLSDAETVGPAAVRAASPTCPCLPILRRRAGRWRRRPRARRCRWQRPRARRAVLGGDRGDEPLDGRRARDFDASTDCESRAIAERFAPTLRQASAVLLPAPRAAMRRARVLPRSSSRARARAAASAAWRLRVQPPATGRRP